MEKYKYNYEKIEKTNRSTSFCEYIIHTQKFQGASEDDWNDNLSRNRKIFHSFCTFDWKLSKLLSAFASSRRRYYVHGFNDFHS